MPFPDRSSPSKSTSSPLSGALSCFLPPSTLCRCCRASCIRERKSVMAHVDRSRTRWRKASCSSGRACTEPSSASAKGASSPRSSKKPYSTRSAFHSPVPTFLHHRGGAHRIASANCNYIACSQNLFASAAQPQPRAPMRRTGDAPREACFQATSLPRKRACDRGKANVIGSRDGETSGKFATIIAFLTHWPLTNVCHRHIASNTASNHGVSETGEQTQLLLPKEIERRSATACNCVRPCVAA